MNSSRRRLPTFLYIGADKSGSTWLYEVLRQHPSCFVPRAKDIYFFDRHYDRGLDWYARFFAAAPTEAPALGELSHDYLYSVAAAARIARDLPDIRLVAFLRDPVERCFSEYLHLVRNGLTRKPFRTALDDFPEVLEHSRYAHHLRPYVKHFDRERLGIFFFDDLVAGPLGFGRAVLRFLGLEWLDEIDVTRNPMPAARPRSPVVARLASQGADAVRRLGLPGAVGRLKASRWGRELYVPYDGSNRPRLGDSDRVYLQEQLGSDTDELRGLLGMELPSWAGGYQLGAAR